MVTYLVLVRHSVPEIVPDVPAVKWRLSEEGRRRAGIISSTVESYHPGYIFSSNEPKAMETASIIAENLDIEQKTVFGIHEHQRSRVDRMDTIQFKAQIASLLEYPDRLVFGDETASQAYSRFNEAMVELVLEYPDESLIVVSHGTVITLFVSSQNDVESYRFWRSLDMPGLIVLSRPDFKLVEVLASDGRAALTSD